MQILQSWKESLQLLLPPKLVPFVKEIGILLGKTYLKMFQHWCSLYVISCGTVGFLYTASGYHYRFLGIFVSVLGQIIILFTYFAAASTLQSRSYLYFIKKLTTYWYVLFIYVVVFKLVEQHLALATILFQWLGLWFLFLMDSKGSVKDIAYAALNAGKLFFYNMPLLLLFYLWIYAIAYFVTRLFLPQLFAWNIPLAVASIFLFGLLFIAVEICSYVVIYNKRRKAQAKLYEVKE